MQAVQQISCISPTDQTNPEKQGHYFSQTRCLLASTDRVKDCDVRWLCQLLWPGRLTVSAIYFTQWTVPKIMVMRWYDHCNAPLKKHMVRLSTAWHCSSPRRSLRRNCSWHAHRILYLLYRWWSVSGGRVRWCVNTTQGWAWHKKGQFGFSIDDSDFRETHFTVEMRDANEGSKIRNYWCVRYPLWFFLFYDFFSPV